MSIFLPLYKFYIDYFYKLKEDGLCPFTLILSSSVAKSTLYRRYKGFIEDEGMTPIESLPLSKKHFYWSIAIKLNPSEVDNEVRIRTAKAAYVLSLISSND